MQVGTRPTCVMEVAWMYDGVGDLPLEVRKCWVMYEVVSPAQMEDLRISLSLNGSLRSGS